MTDSQSCLFSPEPQSPLFSPLSEPLDQHPAIQLTPSNDESDNSSRPTIFHLQTSSSLNLMESIQYGGGSPRDGYSHCPQRGGDSPPSGGDSPPRGGGDGSSSSAFFFPTPTQKDEIKILKQYIQDLENTMNEHNRSKYGIIRKKLQEYLAPSLQEKLTHLPTYPIKISSKLISTYFLSSHASERNLDLVCSNIFKYLLNVIDISMLAIFIVCLFGFVPSECSYLPLFMLLARIPVLFAMNVDTLKLLTRTWDFWYTIGQSSAFCVEAYFLFSDHRKVLGIIAGIVIVISTCLDSLPERFRRLRTLIWLGNASLGIFSLVCLHYDFWPNISHYQFHFYSLEWEDRQMIESTGFVVMAAFLRFAWCSYKYPKDTVFIKLNVKVRQTT